MAAIVDGMDCTSFEAAAWPAVASTLTNSAIVGRVDSLVSFVDDICSRDVPSCAEREDVLPRR